MLWNLLLLLLLMHARIEAHWRSVRLHRSAAHRATRSARTARPRSTASDAHRRATAEVCGWTVRRSVWRSARSAHRTDAAHWTAGRAAVRWSAMGRSLLVLRRTADAAQTTATALIKECRINMRSDALRWTTVRRWSYDTHEKTKRNGRNDRWMIFRRRRMDVMT